MSVVIVPLAEWYPAMAAKWTGIRVPREDRERWVVHHSAGGTSQGPLTYARDVADFHYKKWRVPGGYSFLVGTDGIAREMCGFDFKGVHSGTQYWNQHGLAVCFQGSFMTRPPSDLMLATATEIIASFPLPQTTHRAVRPTYTDCPGDALIALLPLLLPEDPAMKPPSWAIAATQWHIDRGIYTSASPDDVDESNEFHRQSVFRHRFYNAIKGEFGAGGVSEAEVKELIRSAELQV